MVLSFGGSDVSGARYVPMWGLAGEATLGPGRGGAPSAHSTLYFVQGSWPVLGTCWTGRTGPSLYLPYSEARQHRELRTVGDGSYTERQVPRAHSSCVCISVPSRAIAQPDPVRLTCPMEERGEGRKDQCERRERVFFFLSRETFRQA